MKRAISLIVVLFCLIFVVQLGSTFFKSEHDIKYDVTSGDTTFKVEEMYEKKQDNTYDLKIDYNNISYFYTVPNTYNKQKKIIKNIEVYNKNNTICILPILIDDKNLDIECSIDSVLYSYEALKNNSSVLEFVSYLKDKKYTSLAWEDEILDEINYNNSIIYKNNILSTDSIVLWKYKGIDVITDNNRNTYTLYSYDKYENTHGTVVGKYYVVPSYDGSKVFDFNELSIIDLEKNKQDLIKTDAVINQDTYINGVVDNKLYYFDPDNLTQYEVDPANKKISVFGKTGKSAQYYNGKWSTLNVYDFVGTKKQFEIEVPQEISKYNPKKVFSTNTGYYFITSDNSFYRVARNHFDNPILLWKIDGIKEIQVVGDTIYFIKGDTIYYYNNDNGIRRVIKNNELNYNYTNIYGVYRKED